jgi:hypothetical protein
VAPVLRAQSPFFSASVPVVRAPIAMLLDMPVSLHWVDHVHILAAGKLQRWHRRAELLIVICPLWNCWTCSPRVILRSHFVRLASFFGISASTTLLNSEICKSWGGTSRRLRVERHESVCLCLVNLVGHGLMSLKILSFQWRNCRRLRSHL